MNACDHQRQYPSLHLKRTPTPLSIRHSFYAMNRRPFSSLTRMIKCPRSFSSHRAMETHEKHTRRVLVVGPECSGKTTVCDALRDNVPGVEFVELHTRTFQLETTRIRDFVFVCHPHEIREYGVNSRIYPRLCLVVKVFPLSKSSVRFEIISRNRVFVSSLVERSDVVHLGQL